MSTDSRLRPLLVSLLSLAYDQSVRQLEVEMGTGERPYHDSEGTLSNIIQFLFSCQHFQSESTLEPEQFPAKPLPAFSSDINEQ